jgi:hypothetical protein
MNGFVWNIKTEKEFREIMRQEFHTITHYCGEGDKEEGNFNVKRLYLSEHEKEQTVTAFKTNRTDIGEEEVNYYINEYGARGDWSIKTQNPDHINIAVFGCSFTLGVGVPEYKTWSAQIKEKLPADKQVNILNLGYPGGSISKSLKLFKYLTDVYKIDIAIFLLPSHWRAEFALYYTQDYPVKYTNLIPNFNSCYVEGVWEDFYKYSTADTRLYDTVKEVNYIELIAKVNKIETYYSSWDGETLDGIAPFVNKRQLLPYFKFVENMLGPHLSTRFARDGAHPGIASQDLFAGEITDHLVRTSAVAGIITKPKLI